MCSIDKKLVLQGAAVFATYASERPPPLPDQFTASLIEEALRGKLASNGTPEGPPTPTKPNGHRVDELLASTRPKGTRDSPAMAKVLTLLRSERRRFKPLELARLGHLPNPNESGVVNGILNRLAGRGLAEKVARGEYQATEKGYS